MSTHHAAPNFADWALLLWQLRVVSRSLRSIPLLILMSGRMPRLNYGYSSSYQSSAPYGEAPVRAMFANRPRPDQDRFYSTTVDDLLTNRFQPCSDVTNWLNTSQFPAIRMLAQWLARSPGLGSSETDSHSGWPQPSISG